MTPNPNLTSNPNPPASTAASATGPGRRRVLNGGRLPPWLVERLCQQYDVVPLPTDAAERRAFLAARGAEFEALATSAAIGADAATIQALPNLKVISNFGVGLDRIDLAAAAQAGVAVGYTPDVLNDCVADLGMGLVIDVMRRIAEADRFVRRGDWAAGKGFPLARKVSGCRLGIVGFGRIGRTVAQRASGFDMQVRYHARHRVADTALAHEPSLVELARWADCLFVIVAGGAGTRHLVNREVLDALGPQGFIVNIARGSVIDEAELVKALQERRIAGAGLDVFQDEPRVPEALYALDNCVIVPHIASATEETRRAMGALVERNLARFFAVGAVEAAAPLPRA